jgi:hypothetical protein
MTRKEGDKISLREGWEMEEIKTNTSYRNYRKVESRVAD